MADGSIIIDTSLDNSGAEKGMKELEGSARSQAAKLAAIYKSQGMDASEAFKKAWSEVERSSKSEAVAVANNWERALKRIERTIKDNTDSLSKMADVAKSSAKGIGLAFTAVTGAMSLAGGAVFASSIEASKELGRDMARLETNAQLAGISMDVASEAMARMNAITGETDSNVEGLSNLMAVGFDENQMLEAMDALSGAAIKFSDTLKFEGLADGLQETLATGKAIGPFAELLDRSGVNADEFNAGLAQAKASGDELNYVLDTMANLGLAEVNQAFIDQNAALVANQEAQFRNEEAMAKLGETLMPLQTMFYDVSASMVDEFLPAIDSIVDGVLNLGESLKEGGTEALEEMLTSMLDKIPEMAEAGVEIVLEIREGLVERMPDIMDKGREIVIGLLQTLLDNAPALLKAGIELIGEIIKGALASLPDLLGLVPELISALFTAFITAVKVMVDIGKFIVEGIWEGINGAKDWLLGKVKEWCGSILNGIKSFFGIHSPSRVMRDQVGKMLGLGMNEGIQSTEQLLVDTMETIGERLLDEGAKTQDKLTILEEEKVKERYAHMKKYEVDGIEENYRAFLEVEQSKVTEKEKRLEEIELQLQNIKEEKKLLNAKRASDKKLIAEKEALEKKLTMEQDALNKEVGLLEQFQTNYTATYDNMVKEYEKAYDVIMNKQEALEKKLKAFGELYDVIKDEEGKEIGIKLSDLQEDIDIITKYGESLEALKEKGNVTQEFLDEVLAMSVDDGLKYMELLLSQTDTDFDNYINLWNIKQKKAKEVAQKYYKDQFNTLKTDFTDKVEKQLGLLPDKSKKIGLDASKQLADGMKANSGLVYSVIDGFIDKLEEMERAAILAQQAAQEAASASQSYSVSSYSVTNDSRSTTQNVNFYGKTATPGETYRAIKQASKELIE